MLEFIINIMFRKILPFVFILIYLLKNKKNYSNILNLLKTKNQPYPFNIEKPLFNNTNELYHLESTDDIIKCCLL